MYDSCDFSSIAQNQNQYLLRCLPDILPPWEATSYSLTPLFTSVQFRSFKIHCILLQLNKGWRIGGMTVIIVFDKQHYSFSLNTFTHKILFVNFFFVCFSKTFIFKNSQIVFNKLDRSFNFFCTYCFVNYKQINMHIKLIHAFSFIFFKS